MKGEGVIQELNGVKVAKVAGRFIDAETRKPIIIYRKGKKYDIIDFYREKDLPNGKKVRSVKIKASEGNVRKIENSTMTEDFKILTDNEGNEIDIISNEPFIMFGRKYSAGVDISSGNEERGTNTRFIDENLQVLKDKLGRIIVHIYGSTIDNMYADVIEASVLHQKGQKISVTLNCNFDEIPDQAG